MDYGQIVSDVCQYAKVNGYASKVNSLGVEELLYKDYVQNTGFYGKLITRQVVKDALEKLVRDQEIDSVFSTFRKFRNGMQYTGKPVLFGKEETLKRFLNQEN